MGSEVNMAARLMGKAKPGSILVSKVRQSEDQRTGGAKDRRSVGLEKHSDECILYSTITHNLLLLLSALRSSLLLANCRKSTS